MLILKTSINIWATLVKHGTDGHWLLSKALIMQVILNLGLLLRNYQQKLNHKNIVSHYRGILDKPYVCSNCND